MDEHFSTAFHVSATFGAFDLPLNVSSSRDDNVLVQDERERGLRVDRITGLCGLG